MSILYNGSLNRDQPDDLNEIITNLLSFYLLPEIDGL